MINSYHDPELYTSLYILCDNTHSQTHTHRSRRLPEQDHSKIIYQGLKLVKCSPSSKYLCHFTSTKAGQHLLIKKVYKIENTFNDLLDKGMKLSS